MNPDEFAGRVRDLVARNRTLKAEVEAKDCQIAYLRKQLVDRPSRRAYELMAAECQRLERELDQARDRNRVLAVQVKDLRGKLRVVA